MTHDEPKTRGFGPYLAGSALLLISVTTGPSLALAQVSDVELEPATVIEAPATPTLDETLTEVFAGVEGLTETIEQARSERRECFAAGIRDAREPIAPVQRRTCNIKYEGAILRFQERAEEVFNEAAVLFWSEVELLGNDSAALEAEKAKVRAAQAEAKSATALILEQVMALRSTKGAPETLEDELEYNRLAAAHELAAIEEARLDRKLSSIERLVSRIEKDKLELNSYGYDFAATALKFGVEAARTRAVLDGMRDDLVYERRSGDTGLQQQLSRLADGIDRLGKLGEDDRTQLSDIKPADPVVSEARSSALGASARGWDYFETLLATEEEVSQ